MQQFDCACARSFVSMWLDDELSELEGASLDAHLAACSACREFKLSAESFTAELRAAPLDSFRGSVVMPRRARVRRHGVRLVAGAAAAAAAVSFAGAISPSQAPHALSQSQARPERAGLVRFASESVEEGHAKRANLLAQVDRSWVPRGGIRFLVL